MAPEDKALTIIIPQSQRGAEKIHPYLALPEFLTAGQNKMTAVLRH